MFEHIEVVIIPFAGWARKRAVGSSVIPSSREAAIGGRGSPGDRGFPTQIYLYGTGRSRARLYHRTLGPVLVQAAKNQIS
jgi:hypothetical protein